MSWKCPRCGSAEFRCSSEYDSDGAAMEMITWKHTCKKCGFVKEIEDISYSYGVGDICLRCPFGCGRNHLDD